MKENVLDAVAGWLADGRGVALATVAETRRSAPLPVGTKLAVNDAGELVGSVSGGCVEAAVVEAADALLAGQPPQLMRYGITDDEAWEVGLPCGGEIGIWVERIAPGTPTAQFLSRARADARCVLIRNVSSPPEAPPGGSAPARLIDANGHVSGTIGSATLDRLADALAAEALWSEISGIVSLPEPAAELYIEVAAPRPRLIIVGAVDFGAHLATAARLAGWRPFVIDPRPRFATPARFPDAEAVIAAWPVAAMAQLEPIDRATAIAVLTHDPKVDDAALGVALRSDAGYIGAMGSRPAQRRRRARLQEAGFTNAEIDRISGPIGLDLGALNAGETALSIMSEIVALKHRHSGGRLVDAGGRIHDLAADPRRAENPAQL